MNYFTQLSIEFAGQRNYLDNLFNVYPMAPEGIRDIDESLWAEVEQSFSQRNNLELLKVLLRLDLFPLKDSYVAYFKRDQGSMERNPNTVDRLCGRLYEMGLDKMYEKCSSPKETNRQIGPLFRRWIRRGALGVQSVPLEEFLLTKDNAILDAGDAQMMGFTKDYLGYNRDKGLDFVARFNEQYVIGEAKFLTDFGGHQYAQFNDAISTVTADVNAVTVAILDGVLYIAGRNKMYRNITGDLSEYNIMSSLVLRDFLYQLGA